MPELWKPGAGLLEDSGLTKYMRWLAAEKGLDFHDYEELWNWSVKDVAAFWEYFFEYSDIISHTPYTSVLQRSSAGMIGTKWFDGATVNYAEHIFKKYSDHFPAIIFRKENAADIEISWAALKDQVAKLAFWLKQQGVQKGDRVVSLLPNIPETVIAFLATQSIGAVWSSCSPDFGNPAITDRFVQIEPRIIFVTDGYLYNGKAYSKIDSWAELRLNLPSLQKIVFLPYADAASTMEDVVYWPDLMQMEAQDLVFEPLSFDHPLWILYSSGTTGKPKAITHSVGGNLIEHLKILSLHWDIKTGEKFFWNSTTGWMMWNFSVASLLVGATLMLYDGSAGYPSMHALWNFAREQRIQHFGCGASFYIACMKESMKFEPGDFPALRSIGSTGSPLPAEAYEWIYRDVKQDVWLISVSGGTDICSGFVGGCPHWPVDAGEIQCRLLGCYLEAFNDKGLAVRDELGEMVILEPMPSMPIYFWNDEGDSRYHSSYFDKYPGVWWHGDWIRISSQGSVVIFGRSDATLNRDGVRIGTAEIYSAVDTVHEVADSLVVSIEKEDGSYYMPLFVVMKNGQKLTDEVRAIIKKSLREKYSPRHVPDEIVQVSDIPYTISGKKMETPVKKILMGADPGQTASKDTMRNPSAFDEYLKFVNRSL
jgi:acetoacetyl-CoA synthetase